ncbi:MAG TPA: hypothetical protein VHD56_09265 [Tepidisphaeraceae bacterium]|nr:hypothetical protein [Tepidisphaeraceae bacterium]
MPGHDETTLDTIKSLTNSEPFVSFRVIMTSGDRYLIEDPNALAITASQLHYYPRTGMGIHMRVNQVAAVEVEHQKPAA